MNIEEIKQKIQHTTHNYIVGVKFVTTETTEEVMNSINRDMRIYGEEFARFVLHDTILEINLKSNATPTAYYFQKEEVLKEVIGELEKKEVLITKI